MAPLCNATTVLQITFTSYPALRFSFRFIIVTCFFFSFFLFFSELLLLLGHEFVASSLFSEETLLRDAPAGEIWEIEVSFFSSGLIGISSDYSYG